MIEQSSRPFTGRHMLLIMLAFFATIVAANMTMVYFATQSWTGLVVKNSYVASQQFNETTDKLEKAAAGVHCKLDYAKGELSIVLADTMGKAVNGTNVKLKLGRPSHEGEDHVVSLTARGDGVYVADHELAQGQWSGDVTADIPDHPLWQRPVRLFVKD
jgi:nitrogen fixation protein FixH